MKPFLFLATRDDDEPADAEYEAFLARTGLEESSLVRLRLEAEPLPEVDLEDWSGILVGGSPFNASTPEELKSATQLRVEDELGRLLDRVVAADFPFLGACYGVGTLARHQGAVIDTTYREEVGAPDITLTPAGREDPICAGIPEVFQAFVAHKEAVTVPPANAVVLATGQDCPIQIFRVRSNLYATQFHPELDGDYLAHRLSFYANHGYFVPDELPALQARVRAQDVSDSWKVLSNFVQIHARD
ncbi:MAG: glutamine amidotransferase [Actinomyces bowdenii]|nr:glutamine amidotransferase [Actinomyces bowdenii]